MAPKLPDLSLLRRLFQSRPFGNWEPGWKAVVATTLLVSCAGAVVADQVRLAVKGPTAPLADGGPDGKHATPLTAREAPQAEEAPTGLTPPAHPSW